MCFQGGGQNTSLSSSRPNRILLSSWVLQLLLLNHFSLAPRIGGVLWLGGGLQ